MAAGEEIFLNNRLLDTGHARRYTAVSPHDWEGTPSTRLTPRSG